MGNGSLRAGQMAFRAARRRGGFDPVSRHSDPFLLSAVAGAGSMEPGYVRVGGVTGCSSQRNRVGSRRGGQAAGSPKTSVGREGAVIDALIESAA
jgi:hypothetical protein